MERNEIKDGVVKQIPLHSKKYPGLFMLCDDEDYEMLMKYRWNVRKIKTSFHAVDQIKRKTIYAHQLILKTSTNVDHIDGNGLNNIRSNLRVSSKAQNAQNQPKYSTNTSGYKGVSWDKEREKWLAQIQINRKHKFLGRFNSSEEAYTAYCKAAKTLHGEFFHS